MSFYKNFELESLSQLVNDTSHKFLFVFSCGYEARSLSLYQKIERIIPSDRVTHCCLSFRRFKQEGSRPSNDHILAANGIASIDLESTDWTGAWNIVKASFDEIAEQNPVVLIDYSSMPRNWYCSLALESARAKLGDHVVFLYSQGKFFKTQYPHVGYGEFHRFSGRPRITSTSEVSIFGLGFDSTRTHGIWTYLDPESSVAVLSRTQSNNEHVKRVISENPEIIAGAESIHEIRIDQFEFTLSSLIDIARTYAQYGDVALVPDGPKPLIMAMSLVPYYLDRPGVFCWHVGHVKPKHYTPIDIESSGEVFGFVLR